MFNVISHLTKNKFGQKRLFCTKSTKYLIKFKIYGLTYLSMCAFIGVIVNVSAGPSENEHDTHYIDRMFRIFEGACMGTFSGILLSLLYVYA